MARYSCLLGSNVWTVLVSYLHAWETGSQAKAAIDRWITFYNHKRPHTAHGGRPPTVVYFNSIETNQ
ncbi:transposase (plasmid) [Paracoccus liaowanqingii]|uniref:Transposase n=1 Tax=Paracoccus liaowanqingii TaxID=2560053 RepID=A0A4Y5SQX8_9RHOB|nr:transposase [Paracoccus liaowanqingii]